MENETFSSDVPNENGSVTPEKPSFLDKMIQQFESRYWLIVDNGEQLEVMGDTIIYTAPVESINLVFDTIDSNGDGTFSIRFQVVGRQNVSTVKIAYNTYERAFSARDSLIDFIRNKNEYIKEERSARAKINNSEKSVTKSKDKKAKDDLSHCIIGPDIDISNETITNTDEAKDPSAIKWENIRNEGEYWANQFKEEKLSLIQRLFNFFKK